MSAVKEAFLNNIRYADKSASVDLYEFPDEPFTDEQKQEMAEEHDEDDPEDLVCMGEHMADEMEDR